MNGQLPICAEKHYHPRYHDMNSIQRAAFLTSTLWNIGDTINVGFFQPTDTLPTWYSMDQLTVGTPAGYQIDGIEYEVRKMTSIPEAVQYVIQQRLQPLVNVKFVFVDDVSNADVRVAFDVTKGSWSYVGTQIKNVDKSESTMNFAWLDVGTIIHEFCHTLGMIHEHQNPYGVGIQWNLPAVYAWAQSTQDWDQETTYNNIIKKYSKDQVNGSVFDPSSIMLYFYPASLTTNNKGTTENHQLSSTDKTWLSSMYPISGPRVYPSPVVPQSTQPAAPEGRLYGAVDYIGSPNFIISIIVIFLIIFVVIIFFKM